MTTATDNKKAETFSYAFLDKYFNGVCRGVCPRYSIEEIDAILNAYFFSGKAICELTPTEKGLLRQDAIHHYTNLFVRKDAGLKLFAEKRVIRLEGSVSAAFHKEVKGYASDRPLLIYPDSRADMAAYCEREGLQPMTSQEKIAFLKDLPAYLEMRYVHGYCEDPCPPRGYRSLKECKYGIEELLSQARQSTGRHQLTVLDVGGGVGTAMKDLKEIDSDVQAINLTAHFEPAMFRVDRTILGFAERFPADLRESVDLVVSNMAFRYFRFPDLAVRNIVHSLSIGGIADIFVCCESSPADPAELEERLTAAYFWLKDLEEKRIIKVDFRTGYLLDIPLETGESLYSCRGLYITKLASIT